jgi:hypothetical protein
MAATTDHIPGTDQDQPNREPHLAPASERAATKRVAKALGTAPTGPARLITADGQEIDLPATLLRVLRLSADQLASGRAVLLDSLGGQISPAQAAEILGFPLDYVMKLLDSGELPSERAHDVRLLKLVDVLAYRQAFKQQQREALRNLSQRSQESGLFDLVYDESNHESDETAESSR